MKKKFIVLLMICLMTLLLIACGNSTSTTSNEPNSSEAEAAGEEGETLEEQSEEPIEETAEEPEEIVEAHEESVKEVEELSEAELEALSGPIDVAAYLEEIGEVKEVVTSEESKEVKSSGEIIALFDERGFGELQITAEYTMEGDYLGEEVSGTEDTKHPFYETYYVSATEEFWTISIIDGTITAYPVTYNLESEREVTIIFSETPELTSYDAVTNTFFKFIPDKTIMTVVVVDILDSETLDLLSKEEMDRY